MINYDPDVEEIDVEPYEGEPEFESSQADDKAQQDDEPAPAWETPDENEEDET